MLLRWSGLVLATVSFLAMGCAGAPTPSEPIPMLRVALHTEPQSWNRLLATDWVTHVVTDPIHGRLLRIDPETQQLVPELATSWDFSEDGTRLVLHLRPDVRFSDGEPFTAEDVAFTFRALYDPKVGSPLIETAMIDGEPLKVDVVGPLTVAFRLPRRTAALERMFDSLAILPAHRLEASLVAGNLASDTGLGAPLESIVGLGPFVPNEYRPGERIVLAPNPHFWKRGADGAPLPRLRGIVFEIVPDASARLLRLRADQVDLVEQIAPGDFESLRLDAPAGVELVDAGPSLVSERLWFNLNPASPVPDFKKRWFEDVRFRRAVSLGIDRDALVRVVYRGLATPAAGPVSPANRLWRNTKLTPTKLDVDRARELFGEAGFRWDEKGRLTDEQGRAVELTIVVRAGSDLHARVGAFLQEDLDRLGIDARAVPVEASGLYHRLLGSFDYEACFLGITQTDPDPAAELPFWLSGAQLHLWHPREERPATPWEARIDELMAAQSDELDPTRRKALFDEVQEIVYDELPVLDLVVPHALLGVRERVLNLRPSPVTHALWNADELDLTPRASDPVGESP